MPDVFTQAKRSEVMSRIRSRGNKDTELALASLFRRYGVTGWRRQKEIRGRAVLPRGPKLPAATQRRPTFRVKTRNGISDGASSRRLLRVRPDFVFPKLRLAVFVDGCFWHACPIHATRPRNHAAFWRKKLAANQARDRQVNRVLRAAGWRVLRIWEHALAKNSEGRLLARLRRSLPLPA